jgi:hypothetical protein
MRLRFARVVEETLVVKVEVRRRNIKDPKYVVTEGNPGIDTILALLG